MTYRLQNMNKIKKYINCIANNIKVSLKMYIFLELLNKEKTSYFPIINPHKNFFLFFVSISPGKNREHAKEEVFCLVLI